MNTRLAMALLLLGTATCNAAIVRVEFTAELKSASPQLDPALLLDGYFEFEDAGTRRGTAYLFNYGHYHYNDIASAGINTPDGLVTWNEGIVIVNHDARSAAAVNNYFATPAYQYGLLIGKPTYPAETSGPGAPDLGSITPPPNLPLVPTDYGDIVTIDVDYPIVFYPQMRLSLSRRTNNHPTIGDSLRPPSLDLVDDATLTLYARRYGYYKSGSGLAYGLIEERATYQITSLTTVPEPSTIAILLGMVLLTLRYSPQSVRQS